MSELNRRQLYLRWVALSAAWWFAAALLGAVQYHGVWSAFDPLHGAGGSIFFGALNAVLWVVIGLLALWMAERRPLRWPPSPVAVTIHLGALLVAIAFRAGVATLIVPSQLFGGTIPFLAAFRAGAAPDAVLFAITVAAAHSVLAMSRSDQRRRQTSDAQLHTLQTQLQPDFLFNTLNTITTLVHEAPDRAERVLSNLSGFLRRTLVGEAPTEVTLEEELRLVDAYLEIESARFEGRLHVVWEVDPDTRTALVPTFLLQPLVENALRDGIVRRRGSGRVTISAERSDGMLRMRVANSGGAPSTSAQRVRLTRTRTRLAQLYPGSHDVRVREGADNATEIEILLPLVTGSRGPATMVRS